MANTLQLTGGDHEKYMREAIKLAKKAKSIGEVPVGAVIVKNGKVISKGYNRVIIDNDPTMHAEIVAIKHAAKILKNYRLNDTIIYTTLEPCLMCMGAILHARIKELVYGTPEYKFGACGSVHKIQNKKLKIVKGIMETECKNLIQNFFKGKR